MMAIILFGESWYFNKIFKYLILLYSNVVQVKATFDFILSTITIKVNKITRVVYFEFQRLKLNYQTFYYLCIQVFIIDK